MKRKKRKTKLKTETNIRVKSCTRYAGAEGDEGNSIDTIFKVDEAAEMAGNITDNCRAQANKCDGDDKSWVSVENS